MNLFLKQARNEGNRRLSGASLSSSDAGVSTIFRPEVIAKRSMERLERLPNESLNKLPKKTSKTIMSSQDSLVTSRPVIPSVETSINSRPVTSSTPSTPSFSQNANVINVTINYGKGSDKQQE